MITEMLTKANLSEIEDQIATAEVGDYNELLNVCASILSVLKDLNQRIGKLEDERDELGDELEGELADIAGEK